MVEQVKDVRILEAIYVLLEREQLHEHITSDQRLDAALQASIDQGLMQIERGETISRDEIKKRHAK